MGCDEEGASLGLTRLSESGSNVGAWCLVACGMVVVCWWWSASGRRLHMADEDLVGCINWWLQQSYSGGPRLLGPSCLGFWLGLGLFGFGLS